jgi:hypothetical protein
MEGQLGFFQQQLPAIESKGIYLPDYGTWLEFRKFRGSVLDEIHSPTAHFTGQPGGLHQITRKHRVNFFRFRHPGLQEGSIVQTGQTGFDSYSGSVLQAMELVLAQAENFLLKWYWMVRAGGGHLKI